MTWEEVAESLTGFDEIAVTKHFGVDVYMDSETKPVLIQRALVFILKRRDGLTDTDAYQAAMSMPLSEVSDYCAKAEDDVMADDPDSAPGKDDTPPE